MKPSTLLMISLLFCLPFVSARAAETEPNNSRNEANTLALNGSNNGSITSGDEDWWAITTNTNGRLDITLTRTLGSTVQFQLYDNNGSTLLESASTSGTITDFEDALAPGTYYVRITTVTSGATCDYTLSNNLVLPAQEADSEPNGTRALANLLLLNGNETGQVGYYYNLQRDTSDWYRVTTNANGRLRITLTNHSGTGTIWAQLYDNNGTSVLSSGSTTSTGNVINNDALAPGTYYVRVYMNTVSNFASYTLADSLFVPVQANDDEPNGTSALANLLPLNGNETGHVGYYYNLQRDTSDWYKVTTNDNGRLRITLTNHSGTGTIWAALYDNNGTTFLSSGSTTSTGNVINNDALAPGTYYVRVYMNTVSNFASYTLADSLFVPVQANDDEPNGTSALSNLLPLNGNETGHVGYYYNLQRDTSDWYKVTTNANGRLRITLTNHSGTGTIWAALYDNNGTTFLSSGSTTSTGNVINNDALAPGTYYVRVYMNTVSNFASYTLADSLFVPAQASDDEPNGTRAQANVLPINENETGQVGYYYNLQRDTSDWYRVTTNADGRLRITLTNNLSTGTIWGQLYDNNGTTLLSSGSTTSTGTIADVDGLGAGTYYVRIYMNTVSNFASYTVSSELTTYTFANDTEPNDFFSQSKTIPANSTVTGHADFYYNTVTDREDKWKINYTGSGAMTLQFNLESRLLTGSTVTTTLQVYRDTALAAIFTGNYTSLSNPINLSGLIPGYYYVRIYTASTGAGILASYSITATFTQVNIAGVTLKPTSGLDCSATGSLKIQCSGSLPPYIVQLYNFGVAYGSPVTVNNTNAVNVNNLPTGFWSARVFGDGATGTAFGQATGANLMPVPTGLAASSITATTVKLTFSNFSPCVDGYGVQYRKTGDSLWILDTAKKSPFTLKDLLPATQYTVRVASADTAAGFTAISRYSDSITFTTLSTSFASVATASSGNDISVQKLPNAGIIAMPNPVPAQVKLQVGSKINQLVNASLQDMNGRIVWSKFNVHSSALNNQAISVANMPNGLYLLHITGTDNKPIATLKIVVAH